MNRFLADENLNGDLLDALFRADPKVAVVRAVDLGLVRTDDRVILARAAADNLIVLTHDVNTMAGFAIERVRAGRPMPGLVEVGSGTRIADAVEQIQLLAHAFGPEELRDLVIYLPLWRPT